MASRIGRICGVVCSAVSSYANKMVETFATPTLWSRPTACKTCAFRPQAGHRVRFRDRQPSSRRRRSWCCAASLLFLPGFFNIPPIDRDEARFAQATKQMVESGDFVDIRFQDDVRYKKPVGIYWLQAAAVETASALGLPRRAVADLALSHSLADRRHRRGAADLLGGARLRHAARRRAGGADDVQFASCSASKRGSPRPMRCCC